MADAGAAIKDARYPQFAAQIGSPTLCFAARKTRPCASLTAAPAPAPGMASSIGKTLKEMVMTLISTITAGTCEVLLDTLRAEFGVIQTARILEAEAVDFLWDARVAERYLGQHLDFDEEGESELSRVGILSFLDGSWQTAVCLVDGDGSAAALLWQRRFERQGEAHEAFERAV